MTTVFSRVDPNVVSWKIDNFAERFSNSIPRDEWAGDLYAFDHPTCGRVEFYPEFTPKVAFDDKRCSLMLQLPNCSPTLSIDLSCTAWMEDEKKTRSVLKTNSICFSNSYSEDWPTFLTTQELQPFQTASTVFVCVQLPCKVEKIGMLSADPTSHRWAIDDFAGRFQAARFKTFWQSDQFFVGGLDNVKFSISFCPKGDHETYKDSCGLFLRVENLAGRTSASVQFEMWLESADKHRTPKLAFKQVYTEVAGYGWDSYMPQTELKKFASKRSFSICCTVRPLVQPVESTSLAQTHGLSANFAEVSDVEVCGTQSVFKISKAILSTQSSFFREKFSSPIKEEEPGVIRITDIDDRLLEAMLRFMYINQVKNLDEIASDLLPVAVRYKVERLVTMCTDSIVKNLNVNHILRDLELTFRHEHLSDFKKQVLTFGKLNLMAIRNFPEWNDFFKHKSELAFALY